MGIVIWIVLGLIAGLIAQWLMPGKTPGGGGLVVTILLGIAGGLVGGFIGTHVLEVGTVDGFNLHSLALAIGGAVLLLFIYNLLKSKGKI
ncbi:MAG: GlsB/YeaQ/YmgE family stress response membrane protein [Planctomycetes bacterium]|nr:GlsB/YeaQ/YmgE family stress response membrane protein [Planctomycetota bacterium]